MLSSITLKDFISYDSVHIDFEGAKSIVVVGDNGAGKSALLEVLPFADYGLGRFQYLNEYARLNGDGSFGVEVVRKDVPNVGDILKATRGIRAGKGFAEVWLNDEIVAKGKGASEYLSALTGLDDESFMLTSFFGLGDNDKSDPLLKVFPSKCLETLQKIANVYIYTKFHKRVSDDLKAEKRSIELLERGIEVAEELLDDVPTLKKSMERARACEDSLVVKLGNLRAKRNRLVAEEEKYQAVIRERDTLQERREQLRSSIDKLKKSIERLELSIEDSKNELDEAIEEREHLQSNLKKGDIDVLSGEIEDITSDISSRTTIRELKSVATSVDLDDASVCPLCESPITDVRIKKWHKEVARLDIELEKLMGEKNNKGEDLRSLRKNDKRLIALKQNIKSLISSVESDRRRLSEDTRQKSVDGGTLDIADSRYADLCKKLNSSDYSKISTNLREINDKVEEYQRQSGAVKQEVSSLKDSIVDNTKRNKELKSSKHELSESRKAVRALSILVEAWSRYGIPLNLLKDLTAAIEDRATAIYQEFDSGAILIQEVEGSKPGLRFVLKDRKGTRSFGGLSLGEKVMFFIAVRVAVSQIIAAARDIKIDYLVLDEGMGNLSPKNRDNLVRLINKILRKIFPQVIMVSHTEMRDIFSRTIKVEVEGDISKATVL